MRLVSIIVPVYNGEKYLDDCISSILKQTYTNIEIIIVNDGSTDKTREICEFYQKTDARIIIFNKKNEGLVSARRTGILNAHGKMVTFVDSDDWIEYNMIEEMVLMQAKTNAEVVITNCFKNNGQSENTIKNNIKSGYYQDQRLIEEVYTKMLYYDGFYRFGILQYVWSKLFMLDTAVKISKMLDDRVDIGEDVAFVYSLILEVNSIYISERSFYHYRIHQKSMTNRLQQYKNYFKNLSILYINLDKNFKNTDYYETMIYQLNMYFCYMTWLGIMKLSLLDVQNKHTFLFPFEEIEKKTRIVLYGAGHVGKNYYNQLKEIKYPIDIIWIDKNYDKFISMGMNVVNPNILLEDIPDKIIIAIENREIAYEVIEHLKEHGIPDNKIVWKIHKFPS